MVHSILNSLQDRFIISCTKNPSSTLGASTSPSMKSFYTGVGICLLSLTTAIVAEYSDFDYSNESTPPGGSHDASLDEAVLRPLKFNAWYHDFAS
jgi:hypothetical protein